MKQDRHSKTRTTGVHLHEVLRTAKCLGTESKRGAQAGLLSECSFSLGRRIVLEMEGAQLPSLVQDTERPG